MLKNNYTYRKIVAYKVDRVFNIFLRLNSNTRENVQGISLALKRGASLAAVTLTFVR